MDCTRHSHGSVYLELDYSPPSQYAPTSFLIFFDFKNVYYETLLRFAYFVPTFLGDWLLSRDSFACRRKGPGCNFNRVHGISFKFRTKLDNLIVHRLTVTYTFHWPAKNTANTCQRFKLTKAFIMGLPIVGGNVHKQSLMFTRGRTRLPVFTWRYNWGRKWSVKGVPS